MRMRRLLTFLLLLLPPVPSLATLLQQTPAGSASGTHTTPFQLTSSSVSFPSPTVAGSLLLGLCSGTADSGAGNPVQGGSFSSPYGLTGGGVTWTYTPAGHLPLGDGWVGPLGKQLAGSVALFYSLNAPSVTGPFSCEENFPGSGATEAATVELAVFEFSAPGGGYTWAYDSQRFAPINNPTGAPTCQTITTTVVDDLIVCAITATSSGSDSTVASGFTSLYIGSVALRTQAEYMLDAPLGGTDTTYSGSQTIYSGVAVAFKQVAPASPAMVKRHRGSVF